MEILDLSDFFITKPQSTNFSARLTAIIDKLYEKDFNLEDELQNNLGVVKKEKFMSLLRNNKIPVDSNNALAKFIEKVQKTISNLPTANLVIAIQPDEDTLKAISSWFPVNLGKQVLVDIQIDPDLVAGAIVSYKGKRVNGSVKPLFEKTNPPNNDTPQTKVRGIFSTLGEETILHPRNKLRDITKSENKKPNLANANVTT